MRRKKDWDTRAVNIIQNYFITSEAIFTTEKKHKKMVALEELGKQSLSCKNILTYLIRLYGIYEIENNGNKGKAV